MTDAPVRKPWLRAVFLLGVLYFLVGVVFAALSGSSTSNQGRISWRLAAWLTSAALYAAHIVYEHFKLGNSPLSTALHVALAVGIGAFGLAVAADVRFLMAAPNN
jgi:hypothetical protein